MSERSPMFFTLNPDNLKNYVIDEDPTTKPKRGEKSALKEVEKEVLSSIEMLQQALAQRAKEFNVPAPKLEVPPLPPDFTKEHLEALGELFGLNNLEATVCPKVDDLTDEYFEMMYPETQRDDDTQKGLKSYHPDWWKKTADEGFNISEVEAKRTKKSRATWGELYCKSMRSEASTFNESVLFSETIQKPTYHNGEQYYGTKEGNDATKDHLLPVIQEVFGATVNRFNLTWDQINQELILKLKEKLIGILSSKGLAFPENLDIIITPAVVANLQTTLKHPDDSQTNTFDWASTPLITQDDKDSGRRLLVGDSDNGGAGYVGNVPRGRRWDDGGFRLSVVLKNT